MQFSTGNERKLEHVNLRIVSPMRLLTLRVPAFKMVMQKNCHKLHASMDYIVSFRPDWAEKLSLPSIRSFLSEIYKLHTFNFQPGIAILACDFLVS